MLRKSLTLATALVLAACGGEAERPAPAATGTAPADISVAEPTGASVWQVDRDASFIGFRATQNGKAFEGRFSRWDVAILLDPEAPEAEGAIEARIDLASVDAGSKDRNEALPNETWFNVAMHPVATYRSGMVRATGPGTYEAEGTLTIKGITRPVAMPFTLAIDDGGRAVADGTVMLDRSDFEVGTGEFSEGKWVGFEVEVLLHMEATPAG